MEAVKGMVMKHIQGNCLILLAIVSSFPADPLLCADLPSPSPVDHARYDLNLKYCRLFLLANLNALIDDIENQNAAYLARQVDPEGERTVGMLLHPLARSPYP